MIAVSAGHDDLNLDTALADGANQLMTRAAVGQKVGRRDKDALTRRGEQRLIKDTRPRGHAGRGRAVDDEGRGLALSFLRGEKLDVGENLAGGFEPVLDERGLKACDRRAFEAKHRIAPARILLVPFEPVIGEARAAQETHLTVNDDDLAVRAIVDAGQCAPPETVIPADATPRRAQLLEVAVPRSERAYRVEREADFNARARPLRQGLDESARDFAFLKNARLKLNARPR